MNHPTREEWMSYLYDELTAEDHSSLAAHLAVCPDCKTRVSDWRSARKNLDAWQLPARPGRVPFQRPLVRWAAAASLMIGIGFGVGRFATPACVARGRIWFNWPITRSRPTFQTHPKNKRNMKSLITIIVASAALSWPGALPARSQEATATQPLAVLPGTEPDETDLANALAEVQRQVEVGLRPRIAAAASHVGAEIPIAARPS